MTRLGDINRTENEAIQQALRRASGGGSKGKRRGPGGKGPTTTSAGGAPLIDGKPWKYCVTMDKTEFSIEFKTIVVPKDPGTPWVPAGPAIQITNLAGSFIKNLKECVHLNDMPLCNKTPMTPPFPPMGKGDLSVYVSASRKVRGKKSDLHTPSEDDRIYKWDCIKCDDLTNGDDPISSIIEVGGEELVTLVINFLLESVCNNKKGDTLKISYKSKCLKDVTVPCVIPPTNICTPKDTQITVYGGGFGPEDSQGDYWEGKYPGFNADNLYFDPATYDFGYGAGKSMKRPELMITDALCGAIYDIFVGRKKNPTADEVAKCFNGVFGPGMQVGLGSQYGLPSQAFRELMLLIVKCLGT